nr:MAG TPA: hypothetical protein [Caudoviricetes sp.]
MSTIHFILNALTVVVVLIYGITQIICATNA